MSSRDHITMFGVIPTDYFTTKPPTASSCPTGAGEVTWLRAILKRCEELTVLEEGDRDEAIDALADIRGLVRTTLANGVPPVFRDAGGRGS
jgi:hypothetical protein